MVHLLGTPTRERRDLYKREAQNTAWSVCGFVCKCVLVSREEKNEHSVLWLPEERVNSKRQSRFCFLYLVECSGPQWGGKKQRAGRRPEEQQRGSKPKRETGGQEQALAAAYPGEIPGLEKQKPPKESKVERPGRQEEERGQTESIFAISGNSGRKSRSVSRNCRSVCCRGPPCGAAGQMYLRARYATHPRFSTVLCGHLPNSNERRLRLLEARRPS